MFEIKDHWLKQTPKIRHVASPNFGARPSGAEISLIVFHNISLPPGEFGGNQIELFFTNQLSSNEHPFFKEIESLQVSAHALIRRDGENIQFVGFNERAWHAGVSCHQGRDNCNDFSIGIELEGTDTIPYEQIQYQTLALLANSLLKTYPSIAPDQIVGHSDIAPGRKTDPGPSFDWNHFQTLFNKD